MSGEYGYAASLILRTVNNWIKVRHDDFLLAFSHRVSRYFSGEKFPTCVYA